MQKKYPKSGPDLHEARKTVETNRNTGALSSPEFLKACRFHGIKPTRRQASKWSRNKGIMR